GIPRSRPNGQRAAFALPRTVLLSWPERTAARIPHVADPRQKPHCACRILTRPAWLLRIPNLTPKHLLAQLVERAIVVVPHIAQSLPQLVADLRESVAPEEVESQSLPLVFRQSRQELFQAITPEDSLGGIILFGGSNSGQSASGSLRLRVPVKVASDQTPAPLNGALIGHMNNPRPTRAFRVVEQEAF